MIEKARFEAVLGRIGSLLHADRSDVEIIDVREHRVMMRDGSVITRFTLVTVSPNGSETK